MRSSYKRRYKTKTKPAASYRPRSQRIYAAPRYIKARSNNTNIVMGKGFPKRVCFTHKYSGSFNLTSTSGTMSNVIFRANGMYDPDVTFAGHQPMYFDQLSALYDHFLVIGSKITYTLTPSAATSAPSRIVAHVNDDTSIIGTSIDQVAENSLSKVMKILPAVNNSVTKLRLSWSAKKYFGGSVLANTELQGSGTADPTEQSFFILSAQADGAATITFACTAEVEYIAIWKELKDIAQS